jgi:hypothetical protein
MTWQRTSAPNSSRTTYVSGDYVITGIDEAFRSGRWFHVNYKGALLDVNSTLSLAKQTAADHASNV